MALVLSVVKTSISANCNTLVVSDATGNYNVSTNPGGYGAPNPARSSLYINLIVNVVTSAGRQNVPIPAVTSSAYYNTVSSWTMTVSQDGWYELYMFATAAYSGGTTYQLNYIAYDPVSNAFYQSQSNSNTGQSLSNATYWLQITDITKFALATQSGDPNSYDTTTNYIELCRSIKCEATALSNASSDCCAADQLQQYEKIRMKIEGATYSGGAALFSQAQTIVEDLTAICTSNCGGGGGCSGGCGGGCGGC